MRNLLKLVSGAASIEGIIALGIIALGVVTVSLAPAVVFGTERVDTESKVESGTLSYRVVSGLGAPKRFRRVCTVAGSAVTQNDGKQSVTRKTAYTQAVPNEMKMIELIKSAADGPLRPELRPRGAASLTYEGLVSSKGARYRPVLLKGNLNKNGEVNFVVNTSPAAKKLRDFIDFNCAEQ